MQALRNFALNMPDPFPDRRLDNRYCDECREVTNHTGAQHLENVKPDEEPLDDPDYREDGGEC